MKLEKVSFGSVAGQKAVCLARIDGFSSGESYEIIAHYIDNASFGSTAYYELKDDSGRVVRVKASNFSVRC